MTLEETLSRLEETLMGLAIQLETSSLHLNDSRQITVTLTTKLSVVKFFEYLSSGCLTEAFANVSEYVRVCLMGLVCFC